MLEVPEVTFPWGWPAVPTSPSSCSLGQGTREVHVVQYQGVQLAAAEPI